jgi:predicted DNA repair protein MutK
MKREKPRPTMFSLLTLLDDIATTLDDVAVMTKVAMGKTSALMSDDLAVNAAVVQGVNPDRELPMVKAIFLGSLLNKIYAIAGLFLLQALYPPLIKAVLLIGGLYLAYEGVHKIVEKLQVFLEKEKRQRSAPKGGSSPTKIEEVKKIKGAIQTDLILSIEIIVIAQSAIQGHWSRQLLTLSLVGLGASLLIYGMVALLVKVDDLGLYLLKKGHKKTGLALIKSMPVTMKILGVAGTTAMLLVAGGIFHHTFHWPLFFDFPLAEHLQNLVLGGFIGLVTLAIAEGVSRLKQASKRF